MTQIAGKFIKDDTIKGIKILLDNNTALRWKSSGGTNVDVLKYNAANEPEFVELPIGPTGVFPVKDNHLVPKSYVDAHGLVSYQQLFTLTSTDISNQYVDLAHQAITASIEVVSAGVTQIMNSDYTVTQLSGYTRIGFIGDLLALEAGDSLDIYYTVVAGLIGAR